MTKKNIFILFIVSSSMFLFLTMQHKTKFTASFNKAEIELTKAEKEELKTARYEYFFNLMKDPYINAIPENIRREELIFAEKIPTAEEQLLKSTSSKINWQEIGPYDVGGRTRAILIDAANPDVIVAGGVSGGIWKSTDKGVTWKMKSSLSQVLSVTSIAQDTRTGFRNIWYAVGGEYRGNSAGARGSSGSFYGGGFLKSTNNGETWIEIPTNITAPSGVSFNSDFSFASKVLISPTTGTLFVCANASGILRSVDGGSTWGETGKSYCLGGRNDHYYSDIEVNQNGLLAAVISQAFPNQSGNPQDYSPGVYKSTDDGITWINITPSSFPATHARSVLAFVPSNPNWFYVYTYKNTKTNDRENITLFKINSQSGEFTDLSNNLPNFVNTSGYMNTQSNYNMTIAVHPTNENYVFVGGTNLFRSSDGFATKPADQKTNWIGGYHPQSFFYPKLHPDVHTLVFSPHNPDELWVGHDGGISFTADAKSTGYGTYFPWLDRDYGYAVTQFYTAAIPNVSNDTRYAGGTQDNGTPYFRSSNGNTTTSNDVSSGDGSYCHFATDYFYCSTQNGNLLRFGYYPNKDIDESNWTSFEPDSATGQLFINPFVVDPNVEDVMYYLAGNVLWRNDQLSLIPKSLSKTSVGWKKIKEIIPTGYSFTTLGISNINPSYVLYLGAIGLNQPKIYKLENSTVATEATEITPPYPGNGSGQVPNNTYVHSIAVNPKNGNEVIVVFSNYNVMSLWHSTNGGSTWTDVEGNLSGQYGPSIRSATILPLSTGNIYILGTSTGVYSTTQINGSSTQWVQEGTNTIGKVVVEYVTSRALDGTIIAATHGRGMFIGKAEITSVDESDLIPVKFELSQNFPNPFNPSTVINYRLSTGSQVTLKVYDILGREIATLVDEYKQAGIYNCELRIDPLRHVGDEARNGELPSGIYLYTLKAGDYIQTKKMVLLK